MSVLICTYNSWNYILNTLQSVVSQSYKNLEILILDNNSSDQTVNNIKSFKDTRIKIFESEENLWPYGWLNFLLEKVKGEYIAIQDHDDLRYSRKIEKQITFLENHSKYIWCGTKTLMYYEWDHKWFEYFLWKEWYYTIHPSLVFRNNNYKYPDWMYMNDAVFQKNILCKWKKIIYNIDETLTIHRIKDGATNFSYKRYKLNKKNIKTVFDLHPAWYALSATLFEIMRKIVYPFLQNIKKTYLIDKIERIPFILQRQKIFKVLPKYLQKSLSHDN